MSFSFPVPNGPAAEFAERAAQAKAAVETASENNDYALTQIASSTADAAIKAAAELVAALAGDGSGTAGGNIAGHHSTDATQGSSASVSVSYTPTPPTAS
jgi:hypothetical protein